MSDQHSIPEAVVEPRRGFCIYINTFFQGPTLAVREDEDRPCVFSTEAEAQREIADCRFARNAAYGAHGVRRRGPAGGETENLKEKPET